MSNLVDRHASTGEPVAVSTPCPECGSDATETSEFSATCDELDSVSAWCNACGYGFHTDASNVEN